jgi:hypothetical protein
MFEKVRHCVMPGFNSNAATGDKKWQPPVPFGRQLLVESREMPEGGPGNPAVNYPR